ncbi:glutamate racemase [Chengkuizengella axinellae]|uniref:Glutamate racemase n=1 Tax=Chengkuizengella axinellae TaxID=3064388 RepID=A0ABT9J046_9BACL|nr:glutamate racemase [Chengkuizengella sp. 2205SS18-9]MDP5274953.1 glutamate racemase [Chengkuizengella sp. 2205SS18-9]
MKIGFFDSGIGGMTVLNQALRLLPNEDYIYYADTLHVPYGEKPKEVVKEHILKASDFIAKQDVKALVIACNTATSIAVKDLRQKYDFPIIGIEPAVKPAVQISEGKLKKVLVLATRLTLAEEKFHTLVKNVDKHDIVDYLPMPGLVEFAENFEFREEIVIPYLRQQLSQFDLTQYGTIVLGCTHFSYFRESLSKQFSEDVDIIDGSIGTVKNLKRILESSNKLNEGSGNISIFDSGYKVLDQDSLSNYIKLLEVLGNVHTNYHINNEQLELI